MRRLFLVCLTVFLSAGLALSVTFSVNAQTGSQYETARGGASSGNEARPRASEPETSGLGELHPEATDRSPFFQVVDNATGTRFAAPGWKERSVGSLAHGGTSEFGSAAAGPARYKFAVPKTDYYTVFARWPANRQNTTAARFGIPTTSGARWDEVDQRLDAGFWVRIGAFEMKRGERTIQIKGGPAARGSVVADAVMIVDDVAVDGKGQTFSSANPDELLAGDAGATGGSSEPSLSTRSLSNPTRGDIVREARRHEFTPYDFDYQTCRVGMSRLDCSCFTRVVYLKFGHTLPDSPVNQWRMRLGRKTFSEASLVPGDLVFHDFSGGGMNNHYTDHVGIYTGNGMFIDANTYTKDVRERSLRWLRSDFYGGKTLPLR